MAQVAASMPLENGHLPLSRYPPGTRRARPRGKIKAEPIRLSGDSPQISSCASGCHMPSSQWCAARLASTQAVEPQPRPITAESSNRAR